MRGAESGFELRECEAQCFARRPLTQSRRERVEFQLLGHGFPDSRFGEDAL